MKKKTKFKHTAVSVILGLAAAGIGLAPSAHLVYADDAAGSFSSEESINEDNMNTENSAEASETAVFEISDIIFTPEEVSPGDEITVRALTNFSKHQVSSVSIEIPVNDDKTETVHLFHGENDILEGKVHVGDNWSNGTHTAVRAQITDVDQNVSDFDLSETVVGSFTVADSGEVFNGPVVNSVSLDKTQARVGESVTISVDVTHESDIEELIVTFADEGNVTHAVSFENGNKVHTKDLSGWNEGKYRITNIFIRDKAGNVKYYEENDNLDEVELPVLSISNAYADTQGPIVSSATFDNTKAVPGDTVRINAEAHDSTGISYIAVEVTDRSGAVQTHYLSDDGEGNLFADIYITEHFLNGPYRITRIFGEDTLRNSSEFVPGDDTKDITVNTFSVSESSEDGEAPQIDGIELSGTRLRPGDTCSVTYWLKDKNDIWDTGIGLYQEGTNIAFDTVQGILQEDGSYKCEFEVDNQWYNGNYDIRINSTDSLQHSANHKTGMQVTVYDSPEDYAAPIVNSVTADKTEAKPGDVVTVTADVSDDSKINHVFGMFYRTEDLDYEPDHYYIFSKNNDGTYSTFVEVTDYWLNGDYYLTLDVEDEWSNFDDLVETPVTIAISGSAEDRSAPTVKSVVFDKTELKPGDEFKVTVEAEDASGIEYIDVYIQQSDISEIYGKLKPHVRFTLYPDEEGKLTTSDIVDNAYSNDTYEVIFIQAEDKLGNAVEYDIEDNIIWVYDYEIDDHVQAGTLDPVNTITITGATGEVSPIQASEISFDKEEVKVGETINITAETTDPGKVKEIALELIDENHDETYPRKVYLYPDDKGSIKGELHIHPYDTYWKNNTSYGILSVNVIDTANDSKEYVANGNTEVNEDLRNITFNTFTVDTQSEPVFHPADYSSVDAAIASVPEDLSVYLEDGVKNVNAAIDAVVRDKSEREQIVVNGYASAIRSAVAALKLKPADYTEVDKLLEAVPGDLNIYTEDSAKALEAAVAAVERNLPITDQEKVDASAADIKAALDGLKLILADYTKVDVAIAKVPGDTTIFTAESVAALDEALDAVVRDKPVSEQDTVDGFAEKILAAIDGLVEKPADLKPADYSEVDKAIKSVPEDLSQYTDDSVAALDKALKAVVRDLTVDEQTRVDGFADDINKAVVALKKKPVEEKAEQKTSAVQKKTTAAAGVQTVQSTAVTNTPATTVTKQAAPATGDKDNTFVWLTAAGISVAGIAGAVVMYRKRKN